MANANLESGGPESRSVVLDFDGTVTESDLLDRIALEFGDPAVYQEVEDGLHEDRLPLREVIVREFEPVTAPLAADPVAVPTTTHRLFVPDGQ